MNGPERKNRVRQQYDVYGALVPAEWETVWEGNNLLDRDLERIWPRNTVGQFSCGDFVLRFHFEVKLEDGTWRECRDPRRA